MSFRGISTAPSWVYSKITGFRNWLYDRDLLEAVDLGAHTISVGNLTSRRNLEKPHS